MKIVMCASEVVPFAKTGGLADVVGALPLALEKQGEEVVIVMPAYKCIKANKKIKIKATKEGIPYAVIGKAIKVYFIDNDAYFLRDGLYGEKTGDYPDNLERFSFFCRRTLELLKTIKFKPAVIHCHDWQSSLVPVYLKTLYANDAFFKKVKTVLTIHNIGYQGVFSKEQFPKLGLDWKLFNMEMLEFYDQVNILKGGMVFSDVITTVSPTYSKEIQTKEFGFGLEGVLAKRKDTLVGIINGLDYDIWNPEDDGYLSADFSAKEIAGKYKNKADLQKICKLPVKEDVPVLGIVSRLAQQKGFDILSEAIDTLCGMKIQMVVLGTGDARYQDLLTAMAKKYSKVVSLNLKFDDSLAHKIYAGSDIFLMPSRYEPCGLGQLISFRYGTIPLVFKTGGLADTVTNSTGFVFEQYTKDDLIATVKRAVSAYNDKKKWRLLVEKAMKASFSWDESAAKYLALYKKKA